MGVSDRAMLALVVIAVGPDYALHGPQVLDVIDSRGASVRFDE